MAYIVQIISNIFVWLCRCEGPYMNFIFFEETVIIVNSVVCIFWFYAHIREEGIPEIKNWLVMVQKFLLFLLPEFAIMFLLKWNASDSYSILVVVPGVIVIVNLYAAVLYVLVKVSKNIRFGLLGVCILAVDGACVMQFNKNKYDLLGLFWQDVWLPDTAYYFWCIKCIIITVLLYGSVLTIQNKLNIQADVHSQINQ